MTIELKKKRPAHWRNGGISAGSEWDVFQITGRYGSFMTQHRVAEIWETGQGWAYKNLITGDSRKGWGSCETLRDAMSEIKHQITKAAA